MTDRLEYLIEDHHEKGGWAEAEGNENGRVAWTVKEWGSATRLGKTKIYELIKEKQIRSVKSGVKRLITTSPGEYLNGLDA